MNGKNLIKKTTVCKGKVTKENLNKTEKIVFKKNACIKWENIIMNPLVTLFPLKYYSTE